MSASLDPDPRDLLLTAFAKLEIHHQDVPPPITKSLLSRIYWRENSTGDIELVFSRWGLGIGRVECSIEATSMAQRVVDALKTHDAALNALVDVCEYWQAIIFTLLPGTHQHILKRTENMLIARSDYKPNPGWHALFEMMQGAFVDSRATMEARLRADPPTPPTKPKRRGGSKSRLEPEKRNRLYEQYDGVHKLTKKVKREYNLALKSFARKRGARGYNLKTWQAEWTRHCADAYAPQLQELLALFADMNNPSASDVAYTFLAQLMGHSKSYMVTLVTDSRKRAKSVDNESGD